MKRYALFGTLAVALAVRLPGIGWGLPPVTPQVRASDLRSSYAFDEDDILSGAAKASVARLDLDPHDYHWGTLHIELVLLALDTSQALGAFHVPWRAAYYNLAPGGFVRVYVIGRLVAVAAALLTVVLLFRLPGEWAGPGMFAAMLIAVSPSHMLQSDQVRVDVTMTAMLALTVLMAVRACGDARPRRFLLLGAAGGLAIASKYSAISAVSAIALAALALHRSPSRFPWRGALAVAAGIVTGFIAGGPYVAIKPRAFYDEIGSYIATYTRIPPEFSVPPGKLLWMHTVNLARFSLGLPALLLAAAGLALMLRRRSAADWIVVAGLAGYAVVLFPLHRPLIRYDLPLNLFLGICAGVALERLPIRWRYAAAGAALAMPLGGCLAQIHYMRAPQPANIILQRILDVVPPGSAIARLMPEAPPLDRKVYPEGPNVLLDDLTKNPPVWVLATDLVDTPYQPSTLALLRSDYEEIARADSRRILAWTTLGEAPAPQDWKYTHASYTLYRRKSP